MRISPLASLKPSAIGAVNVIYEQAFPASERIPFAELYRPPPPLERTLTIAHDDDRVYGFASTAWLQGAPMLLLEFLAVDRPRQGSGIGSSLWHHVCAAADRPGVAGVVLEVEDPDEAGLSSEVAMTRWRRIRFYQRGGAALAPLSGYRVPSQVGGPDLPLRIMWRATDRLPFESAQQWHAVVQAIYAESYGLSGEDLRSRQMAVRWSRPR